MRDEWFSAATQYDGAVHAEFADPAGSVDCQGRATVPETGECVLSMVVRRDEIACSEDLRCGVRQFVTGERPRHVGGSTYLTLWPTRGNPCKSVRLETEDGGLTVIRFHDIRYFDVDGFEAEDAMRVEFHVDEMRFVSRRTVEARYFALPLLNFVSDFLPTSGTLAYHPLRLRSTLPPSLADDRADSDATSSHTEWPDRGILFEFNGFPAFIQPLGDYDAKAERLAQRKAEVAVTAVLVGQLGRPSRLPDDLTKWSAVRLVPALSFATGSFVGTTWAEFRDAEGGLVARHHRCFGKRAFELGHRTIIEKFDRGTGFLLALTANALETGKAPTMAMQYATKAGLSQRTGVEDKLRTVANAVECLWSACSNDDDLLIGSLRTEDRERVRDIAAMAANGVDELASSLQLSLGVGQATITKWQKGLKAVARIIRAAPNRRKGDFASKVTKLLEKNGFGDAAIADAYYQSVGELGEKKESWEQMIGKYRNKVDHLGYFDFAAGAYDILQVQGVANHLHDIVIRVILRMIGYAGYRCTYQTPLSQSLCGVPVDWVTPQTLPNMLGGYVRCGPGVGNRAPTAEPKTEN